MTRTELTQAVTSAKTETRNALQTVYNALNSGQKKKILKDEAVARLFALYEVQTDS